MHTSVKRWIPFASVPLIAVAAAIAIPMTTNAAQDLPEKTPQELLEFVADSDVTAFSGSFTQTSDLGLPDLSSLGSGSVSDFDGDAVIGALVELATTSNDARVYVDADQGARLQVLDQLDERDVIATKNDGVWVYDSGAKTAVHVVSDGSSDEATPPADIPTPSSVAEKLLDSLDASTTVAVGSTGTVAGRSAYELVLTPKSDDTTVGDVTVSIDGETGMPLGIAITAEGASSPAFSVEYTSVDFQAPDAALFAFTPPSGTDVTEKTVPADGHPDGTMPDGTVPDGTLPDGTEAPDVTTTGTGWSSIVELAAGDASASLDGLDAITTPVDGGRVLSSSLVNVLITDDGRVFAGAVSVDALEAAAR